MARPSDPLEDPKLGLLRAALRIFGPSQGLEVEREVRSYALRASAVGAQPYSDAAYQMFGRFVAAKDQNIAPSAMVTEARSELLDRWDASVVFAAAQAEISRLREDTVPKPDIKEGAAACRKCKGTKTLYYQMQTRSADEGMTTYYVCTDCSHRWRE